MSGWIVSTKSHSVTIYRRGDEGFAPPLVATSGAIESPLLPGLAIPVEEIFAQLG